MNMSRSHGFAVLTLILAVLSLGSCPAEATYSIIACDVRARACGAAVQTNNLAVGASVPYAQAGIGALVSQAETNPNYGPRGLALLATGKAPAEVLKQLLSEEGNFEGQGPESRQVAIVSLDGRTAVHTGEEAGRADWAGARCGPGYSIQGNSLASAKVIDAMEQAFLTSPGALGERLLAALSAGDAAGGQKTGRDSAALLVKTPDGWPIDIDLRVDHSADPVRDLRTLFDIQFARQQVAQARRAARSGDLSAARSLMVQAVARASMWTRIWLQAAHLAIDIEEPELALQYLNVAFSQNPAWIEAEIGDGTYASLGRNPLFHKWVTPDQDHAAMASYRRQSSDFSPSALDGSTTSLDKQLNIARELLEVGRFEEALTILNAVVTSNAKFSHPDAAELHSLLSEGYAAQSNLAIAIENAQLAVTLQPSSVRARAKLLRLRAELGNQP